MPTILKCRCGAILQQWSEIPYGNIKRKGRPQNHPYATYYLELFYKLNGKCPECNRPLPKPTEFVETMQADVHPI